MYVIVKNWYGLTQTVWGPFPSEDAAEEYLEEELDPTENETDWIVLKMTDPA